MPKHQLFEMKFAKVYPLYVQKAERKLRTKEEVDQIICWLTGYDQAGLQKQIEEESDLETFFAQAPSIHPNSVLIKGVVCGVRVEEIQDPKALCAWYKTHLGIDVQDWGGATFDWTDADGNPTKGTTAWLIGPADGKQFAPSKSTFMVNYRVEDLAALLQALRDEGCDVLEKTDDSEYGKFGWVMDPEGNKVELWQPPAGQ